MNTKESLQEYFNRLQQKEDWSSCLADDMLFTNFTHPVRQVKGRDAYIKATKGFFSMVTSVELRQLLIDGERACAFTSYQLQPQGDPFTSEVAEVFTVHNGKIDSFGIYFDTLPYPK